MTSIGLVYHDQTEQRKFIREHTKYMRKQMLKKIDAGKIPRTGTA